MKRKNYLLTFLLLLTAFAKVFAQQPAGGTFLDEGADVNDYPNVEWLKGEPITHLDKDKIYIIELWATWCIPCLKNMPHLKMINDKFKDKNVVLIAQDVMEDKIGVVKSLVENKGDAYNFRVAFSGPVGSDFDLKFIQAASVHAIPATFVIQHNKLVWQTDPAQITDATVQLLIDGKFTIDAAEALLKKTRQ